MKSCTINQAQDFSCNISGLPLPKNCLFGRVGSTYWYVDNFAQFKEQTLVDIFVLTKSDKIFKPCIARKNSPLVRIITKYVATNKLYDVKCPYPLGLGKVKGYEHKNNTNSKIQFARAKQAQADFMYRPSNQDTKHAITDYACGKMPRWAYDRDVHARNNRK